MRLCWLQAQLDRIRSTTHRVAICNFVVMGRIGRFIHIRQYVATGVICILNG